MAISKSKENNKKSSVSGTNINMNLTLSREQYKSLIKIRKQRNLLTEQELIRIFIANGIAQS